MSRAHRHQDCACTCLRCQGYWSWESTADVSVDKRDLTTLICLFITMLVGVHIENTLGEKSFWVHSFLISRWRTVWIVHLYWPSGTKNWRDTATDQARHINLFWALVSRSCMERLAGKTSQLDQFAPLPCCQKGFLASHEGGDHAPDKFISFALRVGYSKHSTQELAIEFWNLLS